MKAWNACTIAADVGHIGQRSTIVFSCTHVYARLDRSPQLITSQTPPHTSEYGVRAAPPLQSNVQTLRRQPFLSRRNGSHMIGGLDTCNSKKTGLMLSFSMSVDDPLIHFTAIEIPRNHSKHRRQADKQTNHRRHQRSEHKSESNIFSRQPKLIRRDFQVTNRPCLHLGKGWSQTPSVHPCPGMSMKEPKRQLYRGKM